MTSVSSLPLEMPAAVSALDGSILSNSDNCSNVPRLEKNSNGTEIVFKTSIINPCLTCRICRGYLREAHTIVECLHSFCKSCIFKHLESERRDCPDCGADLGANPLESLMFDRTLQAIMDKLLPQAKKEDERRRKSCTGNDAASKTNEAGGSDDYSKADNSRKRPRLENGEEASNERSTSGNSKVYDVQANGEICFALKLHESCDQGDQRLRLAKPFLRTGASLTILLLKKYISKKLDLEVEQVSILCEDEDQSNELQLRHVLEKYCPDDPSNFCLMYKWAASSQATV